MRRWAGCMSHSGDRTRVGRDVTDGCGALLRHGPSNAADWVHRYNAEGIAGLTDAPRGGRPPALTSEQMAELRRLVLAGPDPARDGVVRWRCVDLCDQIAERFEVEVHERTVGKLLHRMGLSRVQPRPHNPKRDLDAQEAFKKTSPRL